MKRECYSLGALKGQTEETLGVLSGRASKLQRIIAACRGDLRESVRDPRRLVSLAAARNRREVGRIGLDQQAILRHQSKQIVVRPLLEGHDPRERHVPAGIDRELRQGVRASVAMQNPFNSRGSCIAYDRARVVLGVASVNDNGAARFSGKGNLGGEGRALCLARRVVVVVVEAALTHGDRARKKKRTELWDIALRVEVRCVVRVDSGGRKNESRIVRGALSGDCGCIDGLTDADDRDRARIAGAGDYRVAVAGERRVREVGVAVDED